MASKKKRLERQKSLLENFSGDYYQEKKVSNEWHIKMFNGNTGRWQVAVFSEKSYKKYKSFKNMKDEINYLDTSAQEKIEWERPTLESIQNFRN